MTDITWTNITVRLGDLKPWADNPRHSTKAQAKRILASFERFGQVAPIAVSPALEVYDGHQRLSALLTVHGPDYMVEARQSSRPLTDDERRGLVLALANATGSWDWDRLSAWSMADLDQWGFDGETLKAWNNDANNLKEMLKAQEQPSADAEPQTDRAAELLEKWQVKPGDLWAIGEHRLICGDCTDAATVARVMDGERAELIPTSPPYFVGKDYEKDFSWEDFAALIEGFIRVGADVLQDGGYLFVNFAENTDKPVAMAELYRLSAVGCGLSWHAHRVWKRPAAMPIYVSTSPRPVGEIEYLHTYRKGTGKEKMRDIKISSRMIWETGGPEQLGHKAAFPAEFIEKPIAIYTDEGAVVYEPFSGSGTTLVACENLRRRCRAIEISPAYVAVALERMATAFPGIDIRRLE